MIIVKIMGGLGNQMFQYATGLRLAKARNSELFLDVSVYANMHKDDTPRHYELDKYKISARVANEAQLAHMLPQDFQATFSFRLKRRAGLDKQLRPLGEHGKAFNSIVLRARDNTWLVGWWQNEKYFLDIRSTLIDEFVPAKISSYTKDIIKQMQASSSVAMHVRRGDYVTNKHANKEHGLIPLEYYKRASDYIVSKVAQPRYFVFSDDINWCKKNLAIGKNITYVEGNGPEGAAEDIYLMSKAKHNVIANSSFSWWGAWLNDNPNRIVIAPKQWFANNESNQQTEIVPTEWIRL